MLLLATPAWQTAAPTCLLAAVFYREGLQEATQDWTEEETRTDLLTPRAEHLAALGVRRWHAAGYRGQGVKIAVLDSGFRGYHEFLGRGLPDRILGRSWREDRDLEARNSLHGVLCAEILHALAPQAELLFCNWEQDRPDQFLQAVRWARAQGASVLTCSLIMPSWSDGEGGGIVHERLARLLRSKGGRDQALFFASAGNTAQRHWSGRYRDDSSGPHQWRPGRCDNELMPWGNALVSVEACWRSGASYRISIIDQAAGQEVDYELHDSNGRSCALARFLPQRGHIYSVRLHLIRGQPGFFHLVALGARLQYSNPRGSIPFPADGAAAIAVGAVSHDGRHLPYSSCGPEPHSPKPDLVAPVPFASLCRAQPFTGTSAAAPQAAALAALVWCKHPDWSAAQVRQALFTSARDLGPPGPDCETGFGMIALP